MSQTTRVRFRCLFTGGLVFLRTAIAATRGTISDAASIIPVSARIQSVCLDPNACVHLESIVVTASFFRLPDVEILHQSQHYCRSPAARSTPPLFTALFRRRNWTWQIKWCMKICRFAYVSMHDIDVVRSTQTKQAYWTCQTRVLDSDGLDSCCGFRLSTRTIRFDCCKTIKRKRTALMMAVINWL